MMVIDEGSLPVLISAYELFIIFALPCPLYVLPLRR